MNRRWLVWSVAAVAAAIAVGAGVMLLRPPAARVEVARAGEGCQVKGEAVRIALTQGGKAIDAKTLCSPGAVRVQAFSDGAAQYFVVFHSDHESDEPAVPQVTVFSPAYYSWPLMNPEAADKVELLSRGSFVLSHGEGDELEWTYDPTVRVAEDGGLEIDLKLRLLTKGGAWCFVGDNCHRQLTAFIAPPPKPFTVPAKIWAPR